MSAGAVRLEHAERIGESVARRIMAAAPGSDAEVVGSVRRRRPVVGDVELIVLRATPSQVAGALLAAGAYRGPRNKAGARAPWANKYFRGVIPYETAAGVAEPRTIGLDVFLCLPPADAGVLRLIRTGSALFSQAVVTRLHRYDLKSEDGRIINRRTGEWSPAPTEEAVLRLARLPWIPPSEREMDCPPTLAAFSREAAPSECPDPVSACRFCGDAHAPGACP
jgi:DNA polymerase/3'-5' exonuclease PolX